MNTVSTSEPFPSVESELRSAPPNALVATARRLLGDRAGAREVSLLLADYGLRVLRPVDPLPGTDESLSAYDGPAGRAFTGQTPVVEPAADGTAAVHVPVSVRGDRLGVLSARVPSPGAGPAGVRGLAAFATALGHEIAAAERDTDLYLLARRTRRLTLAAEMQWQLLPGRGCERPEFEIGAHLEPAYTVGGDNFDWSTDGDHLTLTVTDGMGRGIDAALLTGVTVGALRNARRAGLCLADQARLADQAVYAQFGGKAYASTLLLRFDLATGTVQAVDAGSPRLYLRRGDTVRQIELETQLPLGMFEETAYDEQIFSVRPGDRLVAVSSGVHGARSPEGTLFGEGSLRRAFDAAPAQAPQEVARSVVAGLVEHVGSTDLTADAAVVCLDWHGRDSAAP
ncbi:PP2C family protein-serine/threonine phosphatase [Streptomyces sp. MBT53]|uniref:PP2C family protein-serine/threonine phosphatase n=1 Tax=Streptomyces sp. MBT53 TaxID=1488384 RepID=UPI001913C4F1|nr:PP2C family protein-serine/threonine phosphatase [Streptomyces sp. MBT53]MBK6010061.1 serine/threonine-protein phosphatase [Streptomyces sp. MBT53]